MAKKLWAGRFSRDLDDEALAYTSSVDTDAALFHADVWLSAAHIAMLARKGIITKKNARAITRALADIQKDYEKGRFRLSAGLEDVHLNIEAALESRLGADVAGVLHTARSRNDQVATDLRIVLREHVLDLQDEASALAKELLGLAHRHRDTLMPGYTHLQQAQPITLGFYFCAHASALMRDLGRLGDAYARINHCPLGACALAGTSHPVDRRLIARLLGFDDVFENALDATGSRDIVCESLAALAIHAVCLSRMAEDLVLWSTAEFGFVEFDDALTTGSSIMPQKKNPDLLELMRGRTGRATGALVQVLIVLKGLPTGYSRDLQEDKVLLFSSYKDVTASVRLMGAMLKTARWRKGALARAAQGDGFATATELADALVRDKGIPFRTAHEIVGSLVGHLAKKETDLTDVDEAASFLARHDVAFDAAELSRILDARAAIEAKTSLGGTSPTSVAQTVHHLKKELGGYNRIASARRRKIANARKKTALALR